MMTGRKPDRNPRVSRPLSRRSPPRRPVSRAERRKQQTRDRLLQAGFRLFAARGVDAVAINEITEAADVGFGSFYNHFTSKEALKDQLLDQLFEEFADVLDRVTSGTTDPAEVLAVSVRHTIERARHDPAWGRLLLRDGFEGRLFARGLGPRLLRDIQRGLATGRFDAPDPLKSSPTTRETPALIRQGMRSGEVAERTATAVLRALGLTFQEASRIARLPLPPLEGAGR